MAGDDLTITLFLIGLALSLGVAGMTQAGWRSKPLIISLFLLAAGFFTAGVAWPWLKSLSPPITNTVAALASNTVSWFVILILGLATALSVTRSGRKIVTSFADEAELILHYYGDDRAPSRLSATNIWRWYNLKYITVGIEQLTGAVHRHSMSALFLTFDHPVNTTSLEISSPDMKLPLHEVKEFTNRYAIIGFTDEIPSGTLNIKVHP
jgi:hypothetical protein